MVFTQEAKRKQLKQVNGTVLYELKQACSTLIELSILYLLKYNDIYYDRSYWGVNYQKGFKKVPWADDRN